MAFLLLKADRLTMTPRLRNLILLMGSAVMFTTAATGCGGGTGKPPPFDAGACATVPTYAQLVTATFAPRCSGRCHGGASMPPAPIPAGPIDLSTASNRTSLVNRASVLGMGLVLVVPGHPETSFLMRKLTDDLPSDGSLGGPMPMGEAIQWSEIPQAEVDAITCWIAGGAP
jgi:hypothetical protein